MKRNLRGEVAFVKRLKTKRARRHFLPRAGEFCAVEAEVEALARFLHRGERHELPSADATDLAGLAPRPQFAIAMCKSQSTVTPGRELFRVSAVESGDTRRALSLPAGTVRPLKPIWFQHENHINFLK